MPARRSRVATACCADLMIRDAALRWLGTVTGCRRGCGRRRAGPRRAWSARGGLQRAQPVEAVVEPVGPRRVERAAQGHGAGPVDETTGERDEPGADGAGDGEPIGGAGFADGGGPAD